jgi:hypothetical protein
VTVSVNRATHCFETVIADIHSAGSRFRCVLFADSKHQREKRAGIIAIPRQSALKKQIDAKFSDEALQECHVYSLLSHEPDSVASAVLKSDE